MCYTWWNYGKPFHGLPKSHRTTTTAIDSKLEVQNDNQTNAEKQRELILDYLHIDKLIPLMFNKLIERIEVGSQEVVGGQKQQEIRIVWRFVGKFRDLPAATLTVATGDRFGSESCWKLIIFLIWCMWIQVSKKQIKYFCFSHFS